MVNVKEASGGLQWKVRPSNGRSEQLVLESGFIRRTWLGFLDLLVGLSSKVGLFTKKAWGLGVEEPKKVIHCFKVALALTIVSTFYYVRPFYEGIGQQNTIWAVLTVVLVFEYTVGATLYKCLNRVTATILAASVAVGINWIASQYGRDWFQPIILGASVFLLGSAGTFSRFIPTVKVRFDYGAMIFVLTYSMISVSGYHVENLCRMAFERVATIAIGAVMCIIISILICPIWAGDELQLLVTRNMETLANSFDGCVTEYFKEKNSNGNVDIEDKAQKNLLGYKCVLNSKAAEEYFANFAKWEPGHGHFNLRHPWTQYLKIGASMRNCAFCMEVLNCCINSEVQAPDIVKKHLSDACIILSSHSSRVLKELAISTKMMRRSFILDLSVGEMKDALQEFQNALKSLPSLLTPSPSLLPEGPKEEIKEPISTPTNPPPSPLPEGPKEEIKEPISTPTNPPPSPLPEVPEVERKDPISTPNIIPLMEIFPLVTVASLLIEIVARIEGVVKEVNQLAKLADFKPQIEKSIQPTNKSPLDYRDQQTMKVQQLV